MPSVAVFGAGGKTGKECVKELVSKGFKVKAVVRSPDKYKDTFQAISTQSSGGGGSSSGSIEVVAGDVTNSSSIASALTNCDGGVIFAASGSGFWSAKSVDYQGVENVADAAKKAGDGAVGRIVLISSCLVTPKNRFHPIRILLNNLRWDLMDNKHRGEEALRASGHSYCIVRPGGLADRPRGSAKLNVSQGDTKSGMVARSDVAAVCVAALQDLRAEKVTLELTSEKPTEGVAVVPLTEQLQALFEGLKQDEEGI